MAAIAKSMTVAPVATAAVAARSPVSAQAQKPAMGAKLGGKAFFGPSMRSLCMSASTTTRRSIRSAVIRAAADDGNVQQITSADDFEKIIADAGDKLVVIDISTTTCGPCKMIYPKFVEMAGTYEDAVFAKINGDTDAGTVALMREWGIRAVPAFHFYKGGEKVHDHTGAKMETLMSHFAEHYTGSVPV